MMTGRSRVLVLGQLPVVHGQSVLLQPGDTFTIGDAIELQLTTNETSARSTSLAEKMASRLPDVTTGLPSQSPPRSSLPRKRRVAKSPPPRYAH